MINVLRDQAMTVYKKKKLRHLPGELNKEDSPNCLGTEDMEIEADEGKSLSNYSFCIKENLPDQKCHHFVDQWNVQKLPLSHQMNLT